MLLVKKQKACGNHEPCYTSTTDSITEFKSASVSTNFKYRRNTEKNTDGSFRSCPLPVDVDNQQVGKKTLVEFLQYQVYNK